MSLYFLDERGVPQDAQSRGRIPREQHWGYFRNAQERQPDLIDQVYKLIMMEVGCKILFRKLIQPNLVPAYYLA